MLCSQTARDGAHEIETVFSGDFQPGYEWASVVEAEAAAASTPVAVRNRFAPLGSTTDDDERKQFKVVQSRRNKRSHRQSADVSKDQSIGTNQTSSNNNPPKRRRVFVYGKSTVSSDIAAAERMRKKAVFCIDNVRPSCTTDQMRSFVESMGIKVFTCFKAKSRRHRDEDEDTVNKKRSTSRICICVDDIKRLLDPRAWPDSITISEWFFKQSSRDNPDAANDKRRRVGSDDRREQRQQQRTTTLSQEESSDGGVARIDVEVSRDTATAAMSCSTSMDKDVADDDNECTVIMSDYSEIFTCYSRWRSTFVVQGHYPSSRSTCMVFTKVLQLLISFILMNMVSTYLCFRSIG